MFLFALTVFAVCTYSTFATPLLGSPSDSKVDALPKDRSLPHLSGRDVNDVGMTELPTCHRDDLYELFSDPENNGAANAFCSIYIAFSSLDRAIVTPTYTTTVNITTTGALTTTPAAISTTAPSATCGFQNVTGVVATVTSLNPTATLIASVLKRETTPLPPVDVDTYPPLRLSSVCSCLVVPSTLVTTLTETASAEAVTELHTVQATTNAPQTRIPSTVTTTSISQAGNNTARTTSTVSHHSNSTTMGTGTVLGAPYGTSVATGATSLTANTTTVTIPNISSASGVTANATATATPTSGQTQNTTATTRFSMPTGTSSSSAPAAYCDQTFVRGNGTFLARYTVRCRYSYSNLTPMRVASQPSYGACVRECDLDSRCYGFSYLLAGDGDNCYVYNYYPLPTGHPDDSFDSGSYVVGSNNGMKH